MNKRRITAWLLGFSLMAGLLPSTAFTAFAQENSAAKPYLEVSKKEFSIAPDIKEYELITNNHDLTAQQAGHVMEVTLGGYAEIVAGYNDDNIQNFVSGRGWGMKKPTEQAGAMETRRNNNVVGTVNGSFFNMSNGQPVGSLVMDGNFISASGNYYTFWIDNKNKAHISGPEDSFLLNKDTCQELGIQEAISGSPLLIRDGEVVVNSSSDTVYHPRTAVGIKADDTVVLYMVDGRQAPYSVGMNIYELAVMMKQLGCVRAINLDGGGSSCFATQREGEIGESRTGGLTIRNRPSDG